ncbi:hypothetical protein Sjap_021822 [Stephania japonica]|uniref:Uncharacterized protein n=1 Tax=Stephania japonica TaxID=461633 RepID=A0AAP0EMR0_9MAGN
MENTLQRIGYLWKCSKSSLRTKLKITHEKGWSNDKINSDLKLEAVDLATWLTFRKEAELSAFKVNQLAKLTASGYKNKKGQPHNDEIARVVRGSRPMKPVVFMKSIKFEQFVIQAGSNSIGVATDMVSMNSTVKLTFNTVTFFGVHVTTPVELSYSQLKIASGAVEMYGLNVVLELAWEALEMRLNNEIEKMMADEEDDGGCVLCARAAGGRGGWRMRSDGGWRMKKMVQRMCAGL